MSQNFSDEFYKLSYTEPLARVVINQIGFNISPYAIIEELVKHCIDNQNKIKDLIENGYPNTQISIPYKSLPVELQEKIKKL